jgi:L,D-transpeptidase catalytic domain/Putative peptidoglycan binding domain
VRWTVAAFLVALALPAPAAAAETISFGVDPALPTYGAAATFSGAVTPATLGEQVDLIADTGGGWGVIATTSAAADGSFSFTGTITSPGSYAAQTANATSPALVLTLRPTIMKRLSGLRYPGSKLMLMGRLAPASAGTLTLRVGLRSWPVKQRADGHFRVRLPTSRIGLRTARLLLAPSTGYAAVTAKKAFRILAPPLGTGASGRAVLALERRLAQLRYALRGVNTYYSYDTNDAVLAFQKVHGMSRTGHVTRAVWARLGVANAPHARVPHGDHIEVSKTRQVLYEVRSGKVAHVVHVSTGATGNTPVGTWHVYGKVPGLNGSGMYYSLFWLHGFAIHGYHSVPAWPASHGCVRTPMWFAPGLFSRWSVGTTVFVFG